MLWPVYNLKFARRPADAYWPPKSHTFWKVHRSCHRFRPAQQKRARLAHYLRTKRNRKVDNAGSRSRSAFGIETRTPYDFLHPYASMRLGAALELSTGEKEVFRIKRPQNSLLDANEHPISDVILQSDLGGIDRASYRTMFSLDDETLEAGGNSILASEGDLGELLFSASAGLADFGRRLGELKSEADGFYRKRARTGKLGELKNELDALKAERTSIDTLANRYAQMIAARESAAARYEEAIVARGMTQARIDEIQRLLSALPRLTALQSARERLVPLETLPEAPVGTADELGAVQRDEVELVTRYRNLAETIDELSSKLGEDAFDDRALGLVDQVSRLPDLRARYLTATKDIPERRLQIREIDAAISGILRRIGCEGEPDPGRLAIPAAIIGTLRGLLESHSGIASSLRTAEDEVSQARRRVDEEREKIEAAGFVVDRTANEESAVAVLKAMLSELRSDDHRARLRLAEKTLASYQDNLRQKLRELHPWAGSPEDLIEMDVPDSFAIESWTTSLAAARVEVDHRQRDMERITSERDRLAAELDVLKNVAGVVTDDEAGSIRSARDGAWTSHRRQLDSSSADIFEEALRRDDAATSARLAQAYEMARQRRGLQALAVLDVDIAKSKELLTVAKATLQRTEANIADAVRSVSAGMPTDTSPERLGAWLASRKVALEAFAAVRSAERDRLAARADGAAHLERLKAALDMVEVPYGQHTSIEQLMALGQAAVDRATEIKQLRSDFHGRQGELAERERVLKQVSGEEHNWNFEWSAACSLCWLGDAGPRRVAEVREIIAAVGDLGSLMEKKSGLADRVVKMERDQEDFAVQVRHLANALSLPTQETGVHDLAAAIETCVCEAVTARDRCIERRRAVEAAKEKQRELSEAMSIHEGRKAELLRYFGVGSLSEVGVVLQQLERRASLRDEAEAARADIINAIGSSTIDEAVRALEAADRTALERELAELKARFAGQDQRSRELFTEHSKAVDAVCAIGDDDAVARVEERRRTVLLEIEDKAARYLKLRIGVAAAEQALRIYRDRHRSSMMTRASEAFRTISQGAYKGLTTQPDKDTEILVAVTADGGSKVASALSKGTRFQLYLALRVAGYHEFVALHRPVPFLADDIMETFDDFRAEEAFRLFSEMAQVGQVIYFTHHRHLCDIARKVCPGVTVHDLPRDVLPLHVVESSQKVA